MKDNTYYRRPYIIMSIAVVVVLIYAVRLFQLQVIDQSGKERAANNAQVRQTIFPTRGLIYDRNGELLVYNQPIYEVTMITKEMQSDFDTLSFCQSLKIDTAEFNLRMSDLRKRRGYNRYTPQPFLTMLQPKDVAELRETLFKYAGVGLRKRSLRDYTHLSACHLLGSVGEVNKRDLERDEYYSPGDYSGRDGFERMYEEALRGEKGVEILMRDVKGRIQGRYKDGKLDKLATAGQDLTITIDIELQELAEELLGDMPGSVVAIEPETGEVLAMVSHPAWDPHELVGRKRSENYNRLLHDKRKPLMNRATQATYPPGSTFKTLQALVCLHEGGITEHTLFPCSGPASSPIKCTHHHGSPVNLGMALEQSCNPYFHLAYKAMLEKGGDVYRDGGKQFRERYEIWREDMMSFGLGHKFVDSDIPEQSSGNVPSVGYYDRWYGKGYWKAATIRSNSIGQGEVLLTPLQMANQAAAIANEGFYITPHILKNDTFLTHRHETGIEREHFWAVKQGMHRVMTNGTGRRHNVDSLMMCGKTGTAQNSHGRDHALFIGFAPMEQPKIAVAVVVENAGFGATWACPIATKMMTMYLNERKKNK